MQDIYYPSKDGKNTIHACIWRPEGEIKGVVQIIHGMAEYASRYSPFAEFLASNGYLVCADDHLGHGLSVKSEADLGYFSEKNDYKIVVEDIRELTLIVKKQAEGKPYFMLGHSMGSFFCRKYISLYGKELAGAVIMGSGFKDKLTLNTALFMVKLCALFGSWRKRSKLIKNLAFGSYNKKFKPVRTDNDWLSENQENVDTYNADPLCGVDFTLGGYKVLFSIIKQVCSNKVINAVPKDLPVYFVAGEDDPVGDYGKGVIKSKRRFEKAGIKDVQITLYKNSRHEILNDNCKEQVYSDVLGFFNSNL